MNVQRRGGRSRMGASASGGTTTMPTKNVNDAVDALFVRCIASENSLKTFERAASLVHRVARAPEHEHWEHLATALDEQGSFLRMLRTNRASRATEHAARRGSELKAFCTAQRRRGRSA